jgi:hypothetical protein
VKVDWDKDIKFSRPSRSWFGRIRAWLGRGPSLRIPSLSLPSFRAQALKGPSLKRPKALAGSPSIKLPRLVTDLFADLRDRHLLPLVALLLIAIVAAPILLGNSSEKKQPAVAVIGSSGGETSGAAFTVVPAARQLRSPGKRLAHRHALDPFRIDTKAAEPESSEATGESEAGGTGSTEPPASGGDNEIAITESSSGGSSGAPPVESASVESSPSAGGESTSSSTTANVTVQNEVVGYTVDMKTGVVPGELSEKSEVEPMTKLPSAKNPVVLFVGLSQGNKRALFLMTSKVTAYNGAVHCAVDKNACQMVELKPGHAAVFSYGLGEAESRFKIVLKKIEPVVKTSKAAATKTVETTTRERPAPRGSAVSQAVVGQFQKARR